MPGSYYVLYEHQRRRQLAARGHCHSSTAISARRPAAEVKLLLRVYLPRPVVGHRVAQATALPSRGGAEAPFVVVESLIKCSKPKTAAATAAASGSMYTAGAQHSSSRLSIWRPAPQEKLLLCVNVAGPAVSYTHLTLPTKA